MPLTGEALDGADVIVTMGRSVGDVRPPGSRHEDWRIGDPVGAELDEVRRLRTRSTCASVSSSSTSCRRQRRLRTRL